jgi:DNA polymerase III alpha subunit
VRQAAALGYHAIAITDTNTLAGIVRAHVAAKDTGIQLIVGCCLRFTEPLPLTVLAYPTDLVSYGRLCRLLTTGKRRAPKGECRLELHDLIEHQEGLIVVAVRAQFEELKDGRGKLLLFTEHRDTLNYLAEHLRKWGYTTCEIHGGMNPHERKRAQEQFRTSTQMCVATEAAGEGITASATPRPGRSRSVVSRSRATAAATTSR